MTALARSQKREDTEVLRKCFHSTFDLQDSDPNQARVQFSPKSRAQVAMISGKFASSSFST